MMNVSFLKSMIAGTLLGVLLIGCRNVAPIQRQYHAHPFMSLSPDPAKDAFVDKIFESREAAAGGKGNSAGGGCGCN